MRTTGAGSQMGEATASGSGSGASGTDSASASRFQGKRKYRTTTQADSVKFENEIIPAMKRGEIKTFFQAGNALGKHTRFFFLHGPNDEPLISIDNRSFNKDHPLFAQMTDAGRDELQKIIDDTYTKVKASNHSRFYEWNMAERSMAERDKAESRMTQRGEKGSSYPKTTAEDSRKFETEIIPAMKRREILSITDAALALGKARSYFFTKDRRKEPRLSVDNRSFMKDHPLFAGMSDKGRAELQDLLDSLHEETVKGGFSSFSQMIRDEKREKNKLPGIRPLPTQTSSNPNEAQGLETPSGFQASASSTSMSERSGRAETQRPSSSLPEGQASGSSASRPIKVEPINTTPAVRVPRLVETPLDQARTAFYEEVAQVCDLSGDAPRWSSMLDRSGGVIVHHRMQPVPENDNKFPLRDPDDPSRVHPRYAADDGSTCHSKVKLTKIELAGKKMHEFLREMAANDSRLRLEPSQIDTAVAALTHDARQEFERLIFERTTSKR